MVECILLVSSILFCTASVYRSRIGIRKAIQQRMLDIANCAAGSINGEILKTIDKDAVGNTDYNHIYDTLAVFRDNIELEYIYSIKEEGDDNFIFTMDLDPKTPAAYGDSVAYTKALSSAGDGVAAVDEVPYSDKWGKFYSAYSPVFDSSGKVVGIIAVDFSADWFESQFFEQTRSTILSYLAILIFTLLIAAMFSVIIVRPFVGLHEKLLEEKLLAESASNAKSEFLANMSHEIRTPINAVLGMNEMIIRENGRARELTVSDSKETQDALKNISIYASDVKQAGNNLLSIVNDILDFSKIEAGRLDIVESSYGLSSLLNDLRNMILFKAQEKGLTFIIEVDKTLPDELYGDEVRIRQIITNILTNAVKYTEEGFVKLSINGEKQSDEVLMLTVSVQDTGIGIRPEDIEKLFTKFQRLEMVHNSTLEGTGLGLAITNRLLEMLGGTIKVESEYGHGSTFTVNIPQRIISPAPVGDLQARFEASEPDTDTYKETFRAPTAHILAVDDTRINLTVVINLLRNTQVKIDTAISGEEAVEMAKNNAYDLILMDQRMPEMDGTQALHCIRETKDGLSCNSPVICLTANAVVGSREQYISEGFTDYLTKPIESGSLERMLIKHLPADKVERIHEDVNDTSKTQEKDVAALDKEFPGFRAAGIEPLTGLTYCQNDKTFYTTILTEYVQSSGEKTAALQKNFSIQNWAEYSIHVHSLKSTSKMIGATNLFKQAGKLETASDKNETATILSEHDSMMKKYETVLEAIRKVIPDASTNSITENKDADTFEFSPEDDGIMEFLPEE